MSRRRKVMLGLVLVLAAVASCTGALVMPPNGERIVGVPDASLLPADRSVEKAVVSSSEDVLYFAYGSNMDHAVFLERRGFHPVSSEAAHAPGHELVFGASGVNMVEPVFAALRSAIAHHVHGVLYRLPRGEVPRLHGLEEGYDAFYIDVVGRESGPVRAYTYQVPVLTAGLKPSRRYVESLIRGARQHGLPPEYVAALEQQPVTHVPILSSLSEHVVPFIERTFFDRR